MPYHFKIQEFSARGFFNLSHSPQSQSHFTSFENNLVYCSLNFINCVNCICTLKWWEKKMKRERKRVQSKLYAPFNGINRSGDIYIRMLKKIVSMLVLVNSCFFQFQRFKWHSVQVCFVTIENGGTLHHISCFARWVLNWCESESSILTRFEHYCVFRCWIWKKRRKKMKLDKLNELYWP